MLLENGRISNRATTPMRKSISVPMHKASASVVYSASSSPTASPAPAAAAPRMSPAASRIHPWRCSALSRRAAEAAMLERVHYRADDARARVGQLAHGTLAVRDARMVLARDEQRIVRAERDALRIGIRGGRRRVDDDGVVLRLGLGEQRGEARAREQLERVGRQ